MNNSEERKNNIVHDLLLIQTERTAAYEKMIKYIHHEEAHIYQLLEKMAAESRSCITELRKHIDTTHSEPADRAELKGDANICWPGIQFHFPANPSQETILCCELIEKTTLRTYEKALRSADYLNQELLHLVYDHWMMIRRSAESIYMHKVKPSAPEIIREERMPYHFSREINSATAV